MQSASAQSIDERTMACAARDAALGRSVYLRAVVEFTNVCHHNCLYCGMRVGNLSLERYTLNKHSILDLAKRAHGDGVRTVMIQGGDHLQYDISELCDSVRAISQTNGQTVLLCLGDRSFRDYEKLYAAGATQAIMKFETSNEGIHRRLRPHSTLEARLDLIHILKAVGYQVSSGFICGLPGTSVADIERDIDLLSQLPLFAASVSPFIPNDQSPLAGGRMPTLDEVLHCMAQIRLRMPKLKIPSVSALNLLARLEGRRESGQFLGLMAGANVLTINYTPPEQRNTYVIYTTKREIVEVQFAKQIACDANLEIN